MAIVAPTRYPMAWVLPSACIGGRKDRERKSKQIREGLWSVAAVHEHSGGIPVCHDGSYSTCLDGPDGDISHPELRDAMDVAITVHYATISEGPHFTSASEVMGVRVSTIGPVQ